MVKLYTAVWFPHLATVVDTWCDVLDPERVVLRLARTVGTRDTTTLGDGDTIVGRPPGSGSLPRARL